MAEDAYRDILNESLELIDGFTEGSWIVDRVAGTIKCSEKWAARIGLDKVPEKEQLSYTHTLVHPDDRQNGNSIEHCIETGVTRFDLEYRVKTADSGYIWTENKGKIVYDDAGRAIRVYAATIDITERKRTEEALLESTRALEEANRQKTDILESISDCFYALDRDLRFTYVNKAAEEIWGISRTDLLGRNIADVFPSLIDISLSKFQQALEEQQPVCYEVYSKVINRWGDMSVVPTPDGISVFFRDTTDRKKAGDALRESEKKLRDILEQLPVGVAVFDRDGNAMLSNKQMRFYMPSKIPSRDPKGKTQWRAVDDKGEVIPPDQWPGARALRGENVVPGMELTYSDLSSKNHWILVSASPLRSSEGDIIGGISVAEEITERKRIDEALRESETKLIRRTEELEQKEMEYLEIIDSSSEGTFIHDLEKGEIYYSNEWKKRLGISHLSPAQATKAYLTLVHPDDVEGMQSAYANALTNRLPKVKMEFRALTDSGLIWILGQAKIIYDSERRPVKYYGTHTDITDRKLAQEALRESEERFHIAAKNSSLEFAQFDTDLRYLWIDNPHMSIETSQILGKRDIDLEDSEGMSQLFDLKCQVIRNEKSARKEICFNRKDGLHVYDFFIDPIYDTNRALIGGTSTALDITKHKQEQEGLIENQERLNALMDNNPSLVFLKDEEGRYVYLNKAYIKNFIPSGNWYGKTDYDFWPKESAELFRINDADVLNSGQITQFLEDSKDLKETRYCWLNYKFPFTDSKNRRYLGGIGIDATRLILAEEALKESEAQMKQLVKKLEEADKNKNHFISVLSHELRNPMAAVVAGLSLLESSEDKAQRDSIAEIIRRQATQLRKLTDDLLDLTRINENKIKLKKETVCLNDIVTNAAHDIKFEYKQKGVHLWVKTPNKPINVEADPVRMTQCIGNLLNNALKFTQSPGDVWLTLEQDKRGAIIRVKDNGIGIGPDLLEHIYEPFTQADDSLDRSGGGLGLGLSIVKGLIEMHGGSVKAASGGRGRGSEFILHLSVASGVSAPGIRAETPKKAGRILKIIIIDDSKAFADIMRATFEATGHQAYAAYDGPGGLELAKKIRPDIVLCDIGLPGKSGYEVAAGLKSDPELKNTYLVALTGYIGSSDRDLARKNGFDAHLAKPVDMAVLEKILSALP